MSLYLHEIAEANHKILNPFTEEKLMTVAAACRLRADSTVLDLACGKAEMLAQWAHHYRISGVGVDISSVFIEAARGRGVVLAVGHSERFNPAVIAARPYIKDPRFIEVHRLGTQVGRSLDIDVVLDLMIHDLDMILSTVPSEVDSVEAVGVPVLTPKVDIANARVRFTNGCIANLTASRISRDRVRKIRFFHTPDGKPFWSVAREEGLDDTWAEPPVFDGCSSAGQSKPGRPQPIQIIRKAGHTGVQP